jgi:hypothetical protein
MPFVGIIVNSLKLSQNFLNIRSFRMLPDITKLDISLDEDSINEYFGFDKIDIKAIKNETKKNKITDDQKQHILDFDITTAENGLTKTQVKEVQSKITEHLNSEKTRKNKTIKRKPKKDSKKASNKTSKKTHSKSLATIINHAFSSKNNSSLK